MKKSIIDGKVVKFMASDRKYVLEHYPAVAALNSTINNYVTGQHYDPRDADTFDGLTFDEISGAVKIPQEKRNKFIYIITDTTVVHITHNKPYDCRLNDKGMPLNPQDYWEARFILEQDFVAKSKADVTPKHKFYLDDKEAVAKSFIEKDDAVYHAEKLIREKAKESEYKNLIMALNYTVPGFNENVFGMSYIRMKEILLKQAKSNPSSIEYLFTKEGRLYMFVSKLLEAKVLARKTNGIYEGRKYIAANIPDAIKFIQDKANTDIVNKWTKALEEVIVD